MLELIHTILLSLGIFLKVSAYLDIEILKVEQLSDNKYVDYSGLYVKKVNKTKKLFGNTTYHIDLDNTFFIGATVYMKQGGEYRLMPFKLKKKEICDFYNEDKFFYDEMCKFSDWEIPFKCPQPAGIYAFKGYSPSLKNWPITILHTGEYAGEVNLEKDGVVYFTYRMYVSVINV